MIAFLQSSALLVLFVVVAAGYLLGRVQVRGFGLGVAAVLFAGLAVGAIDRSLALPGVVQELGLVVFVYSIGLASGPGFFASFRRRGLRDNAFALALVTSGAALAAIAQHALSLRPGVAVGMFAGSLTNTPALAASLDWLRHRGASDAALADPVVGYSVTYPLGVVGVLVAMAVARRLRARDEERSPAVSPSGAIVNRTARVTRTEATERAASAILRDAGVVAVLSRIERAGAAEVATEDARLGIGDLVTVVGTEAEVARAVALFGEPSQERPDLDRSVLDFRRIFVSSRSAAGRTLAEIGLTPRFGAVVTRVRRGDVELVPDRDTRLELGDRVRVVAPRTRMEAVAKHLGDSYAAVSEIDFVTFSVGIALGLLLGAVPIPTGLGPSFSLGLAGGPLVVGLVLGRLERTGPLVWSLPFSASMTLRQLGLVLFLAGVGTRSGFAFVSTLQQGGGLVILLAGGALTFTVALTAAVVGRKVLRIPEGALAGMLAGVHTQPAALALANEQTKDGSPSLGYATVFPVATIAKIVLAEILAAALSR